jgi:hypothetical protein
LTPDEAEAIWEILSGRHDADWRTVGSAMEKFAESMKRAGVKRRGLDS